MYSRKHHVNHIDVDGTVEISPGMVSRGHRIGWIEGIGHGQLETCNTYLRLMWLFVDGKSREEILEILDSCVES